MLFLPPGFERRDCPGGGGSRWRECCDTDQTIHNKNQALSLLSRTSLKSNKFFFNIQMTPEIRVFLVLLGPFPLPK